MSIHDWYRNTEWSEKIEEKFEERYKRSRTNYNRAQYLRIQALYLLNTNNKVFQKKGEDLLLQLFRDFPDEKSQTIYGHEMLGDYYINIQKYTQAEEEYRLVVDYYHSSQNKSYTSGIADVKLASLIFQTKQIQPPSTNLNSELTLNSHKYFYLLTCALLANALNKKPAAKVFAEQAIKLSSQSEPQFSRHKTVGIVDSNEDELRKLKFILNS